MNHQQAGIQKILIKWLEGVPRCPEQEALFASTLPDIVRFVKGIIGSVLTEVELTQGLGNVQLKVLLFATAQACSTFLLPFCLKLVCASTPIFGLYE
jgi:hypothetical protein